MRTGTVSYRLEDLKNGVIIPIGFVGENDFTKVFFDAEEIYKKFPNASVSMKVQPPKGGIYPATVTRDGNAVTWQVKEADVANRGGGELQLTFTDGETKIKTYIAKTDVKRSLAGNGPAPDPVQDWVDNAEEVLDDLAAMDNIAKTALEGDIGKALSPKTVENGIVTEWQFVEPGAGTDDYADLDNKPSIAGVTLSGNKTLEDLGIAADEDLDNLADEVSDVKSAIQGKQDAPETAGTAGQVLGLNNSLNPVWVDQSGGGSVDPSAIAQAVDDWCDENITNPDSPPLDRSLTSSSSAAPADMVGVISEDLNMQDTTVNLLAIATLSTGYKIDDSGIKASSSNNDVYEIAYDGSYSKFSATLYSNTNYLMKAISFQNAQGNVISTLAYPTTSGASTFTDQEIPSGTAKILLNNRRASGTPACTCASKYSKRLSDIENDIAENAQVRTALQYSEKNLFDLNNSFDGLIAPTNGNFSESDEYIASDFIPVEPNTIYTISARNTETGLFYLTGCRYAAYTSAKVYITGEQTEYGNFRTPSNAAYVRFSLKKPITDIQFERRSFATKYVPYHGYAVGDESDYMFLTYPRKVYAVPGLEYNWYTFNVTPEQYKGQFTWKLKKTNTKLHNYGRFIRLESNNTAKGTEKIFVEADSAGKNGAKMFDIIIADPTKLDNVSVLVLGDSTTANGYVVTDLHGYDGNENKITTLGTLGTAPYNHEGRSGWTLNNYFTTSANNPFYNPSTETFDAEYYFNQTGVDVPDLFIINLGINDMHYDAGSLYDAKNTADEFISKVNTVITSLRNVDANMKVAICMTIPPNVDPWGFGAAGTNIIGYDQYRISNLVLCEKLIDEFDYRESEGLYLIPINASLDTQYNMPTSAQLPNSRASETLMLPDTAGNVHPNAGGYYQIADVIYAFLCATFKTT